MKKLGDRPDVHRSPALLSGTSVSRYRGGWALVSGSARLVGLGYAFARQIAAEGVNLVLVDVAGDELELRAAELRETFGVGVRPVACDLGEPAPYGPLEDAVADIEVDLLVCNHMFTPADTPEILDMPLATHVRMLEINARGYTNLVHRFAGPMRERRRGSVIVVASGAGLTSSPFTAAYAANKAYQIALGEALWFELRRFDVDVLVMLGGLMDTQGDALADYPRVLIDRPERVVREVLGKLGRKPSTIPGWPNRLVVLSQTRLQSRRRTVESIGKLMAKGLGKTT